MKPDYSFYVRLGYISSISILVPLLCGIFARRNSGKEQRIIFGLVIVSALLELTVFTLFKLKLKNLFISRIQGAAELLFLSWFYLYILHAKKYDIVIKLMAGVFFAVAAFDLYMNGFNSIDNISLTTECILLMLYAIFAFFHLIQNPVYENILLAPLFWFNTAILVYFSGNLFLFVFSNYVEAHYPSMAPPLWGIHSMLNIIFYLLISTGFWRTARKPI